MPDLADRVSRTIRQRALLPAGARVAVAVSGGADSVCLGHVLHRLAPAADWQVAGLIHVNHQLRGAASDTDETFCEALAGRLDLPFETTRVDTVGRARASGCSIEVAARDLRYAFFETAAPRVGATVVATGHTLDDQAETVLLRLLGGAGTRGLSGVRARRGHLVRPLLDCRRQAIRAWMAAHDEAFREDASNDDRSVPRNRLRHELMPVIEQLAPGGVRALARVADLAADDETVLEGKTIELAADVVLEEDGGVQMDRPRLAALPAALSRRLIRRAAGRVDARARLTARHLEAVRLLVAADKTVGHIDLPGLDVSMDRGMLRIAPAAARVRPVAFEYALEVPGSVEVREAGVIVRAERAGRCGPDDLRSDGDRVVLQADTVRGPLVVRSRRAGDRFRPLGAPGRRSLQDVLVDRKVPRANRDSVPVVVDCDGAIVWVAGVTIGDRYRVTAPESGVVVLEMRKSQ